MINETAALSQITMTLARHFDSLYYVDMENDEYMALEPLKMVRGIDTYKKGVNFFEVSMKAAKEYVAPEDVEYLEEYQSKEKVKELLSENPSYSVKYRLIIGKDTLNVRCTTILCEDKRHVVFCLENVDKEYNVDKDIRRL